MQRFQLNPTLPSLAGRVFYVYADNLGDALRKFKKVFNQNMVGNMVKTDQPSFDVSSLVDNRVAPGS